MDASLVIVGNELLSGHTQDANGPYLATKLRELGHRVRRITVVPDERGEIVRALTASTRFSQLIFVCGGLGPTRDDVTIEAVARFLERPLETPEAAKEQLRRIYQYGKDQGYLDSAEVDEDAWSMARIPAQGTVVRNDAGAAPGSAHTWEHQDRQGRLYVLPGPPRELDSVISHMIEQGLIPEEERVHTVREVHLATFESPVASTLDEVAEAVPEVEIGSYPQTGEKRVIVRFTGDEAHVERAMQELRDRAGELEIAPHEPGVEAEGNAR